MITELFCPAKVNLFLQIEGRREDGYHELTSLVAPLQFGDTLRIEESTGEEDFLEIDGLPLEVTPDNLILQATRLYREQVPDLPPIRWFLHKQIPWGAGLGGGSSNAAGALRLLQQWTSDALSQTQLHTLAATLGADVPLFLEKEAGWMRGKGELWTPLNEQEKQALQHWQLLLFFPGFPISTVWAYRQLAQRFPHLYADPAGKARQQAWESRPRLPDLLFNTLETVAASKYLAIPVLLDKVRRHYAVPCLMSGSGSACFALLENHRDPQPIEAEIRESWGITPIRTFLKGEERLS